MFTRITATALGLALVLPALPVLAADVPVTMDTVLGTTIPEVTAKLAGMGYEVREAEIENGRIEVDFTDNDRRGEVYVSTTTGKPTKIEIK